jgi:hypothetical protein
MQAFGARQHDEKQLYEHKERYTKIALKLVYKHLVPNTMMRNSFMNTKEAPFWDSVWGRCFGAALSVKNVQKPLSENEARFGDEVARKMLGKC